MSKAKCLKCNDVIESKHRHDFVKCGCGEIFLDGGNEYIRAGANDLSNLWVYSDGGEDSVLDREEALQKLIEEVMESDVFDDDNFLDEDFDDFNLGFQAGVMSERERVLKAIEDASSTCGPWAQSVILNGTNEAN